MNTIEQTTGPGTLQVTARPRLADMEGESLRRRTRELLRREIDFIPNPDFDSFSAHTAQGDLVESTLRSAEEPAKSPHDLPTHLRRLCESELLTREQEAALFREMNFLKYCASQLRSGIDPERIDRRAVDEIESLLARAGTIRNHIVKSNMRLVMSIVKKCVTPRHSFDEMLSDGTLTLMQAVDKFDYDRGFRFSTYAYRSIARTAYRSMMAARREEARCKCDAEDWAFEQAEDGKSTAASDKVWSHLRELMATMLDQLDRRERFIVRSRYALGSHRKVRSFQCLADKLGISKERVRQLEQRAVAKLRRTAGSLEMDELFGAAMV